MLFVWGGISWLLRCLVYYCCFCLGLIGWLFGGWLIYFGCRWNVYSYNSISCARFCFVLVSCAVVICYDYFGLLFSWFALLCSVAFWFAIVCGFVFCCNCYVLLFGWCRWFLGGSLAFLDGNLLFLCDWSLRTMVFGVGIRHNFCEFWLFSGLLSTCWACGFG